jgi:SAM-dependent methyltransferase
VSTRATHPSPEAPYLAPYLRAAEVHGGGFGSLLWASPNTQSARFDAIRRVGDLQGRSVLDVGCGRADLLDFLLDRNVRPAEYVGIEAVGPLVEAAEDNARRHNAAGIVRAAIVRADFVAEPDRLHAGADVIIFSGSLNTADDPTFYSVLATAFASAQWTLVFNFLCSPELAGRDYLAWRRPADVVAFARSLSRDVRTLSDYLDGDFTVAVRRER